MPHQQRDTHDTLRVMSRRFLALSSRELEPMEASAAFHAAGLLYEWLSPDSWKLCTAVRRAQYTLAQAQKSNLGFVTLEDAMAAVLHERIGNDDWREVFNSPDCSAILSRFPQTV